MTVRYHDMTETQRREVRMFGCTVEQMREAVEESLTFRFSGPVMYAMSLMSDVQEMLDYTGPGSTEDNRQTLNRAKWILSTYCITK